MEAIGNVVVRAKINVEVINVRRVLPVPMQSQPLSSAQYHPLGLTGAQACDRRHDCCQIEQSFDAYTSRANVLDSPQRPEGAPA